MARRAINHPSTVPPWLLTRARRLRGSLPAEAHTHFGTRRLPDQLALLNQLRDDPNYLLVVLDACRADYFAAEHPPFLCGDHTKVYSAAHDTFEYLQAVWPDHHDVEYVSGAVPVNSDYLRFDDSGLNHLYAGYQPPDHITTIHDVWQDGWDSGLGACPPARVTDRAIDVEPDVVHYQQPHTPLIGPEPALGHTNNDSAEPAQGEPTDKPVWDRVHDGSLSDAELRRAYRSNVRLALSEVARLVDAIGDRYSRIVVTADHGEALGEYGVYAHPRWPSHPNVRAVPWFEVDTVADDYPRIDPLGGAEAGAARDAESVSERLAALGYR